jgi:hypothetical protein
METALSIIVEINNHILSNGSYLFKPLSFALKACNCKSFVMRNVNPGLDIERLREYKTEYPEIFASELELKKY